MTQPTYICNQRKHLIVLRIAAMQGMQARALSAHLSEGLRVQSVPVVSMSLWIQLYM